MVRHVTGKRFFALLSFLALSFAGLAHAQTVIPLPEHPRPDFQRDQWSNLNGTWAFRFDSTLAGEREAWFQAGVEFPLQINVPFPWGSPLSGVPNRADVGWYARSITVPSDWNGRRVFLVVGASDWRTSAWLDGQALGTHQGGYTPFEFDLTPFVKPGQEQRLVLRVDDSPHDFKLEGKQGYGQARGIWQTPYLEARSETALSYVHFTPDIDASKVGVRAALSQAAPADLNLTLTFKTSGLPAFTHKVPRGATEVSFEVPVPDAHLWSLDDPFLYEVEAALGSPQAGDRVHTYFGMRKISVANLPGTDIPYVALNGEPIYLEMTLDQAYHPEGFYTFPSDAFMRDEILRSRQIGLNTMRIHIKVEIPRKLYWADRLGMLIMADVPNSWGEPTPEMRKESEYALRGMIARDYNHPAIFSWITFNETWGLFSKQGEKEVYLPETQDWVVSMYRLAKSLDATRLVEDNSVCCGIGHTETDLNTWHNYLPGWAWEEELAKISSETYPGSQWNFEKRFKQGRQPMMNSEFGNVWGYEGSTGDVDWSWDYHRAMDVFRRHPKLAGWLYTEHHDVINEWNGYWRYDRSEKETGLGALVDGMTLRDLHAPLYIAPGGELSRKVEAGQTLEVPLWASFLTGSTAHGNELVLRAELYGWNSLGARKTYQTLKQSVPYRPWMSQAIAPLSVTMPQEPGVAVLALYLEDAAGTVLQRNFTTFVVNGPQITGTTLENGRNVRIVRVDPKTFQAQEWSLKQWDVLDGLKVNGAGSGFFEYRLPWPDGMNPGDVASAIFLVEASAKQLFGKDREDTGNIGGNFMRGEGSYDPSANPNAYPMTDETKFPSAVTVRINGETAGTYELPDDPADHRGILSWHYQLKDKKLREAGSYGYLLQVPLSRTTLEKAAKEKAIVVRLEVDEALPGGLAIYGSSFGRYPVDPTVAFVLNK